MENLEKARKEYRDLQDRVTHPNGSFDKQGRWYPDEKFDCCANIRYPSKRYPYSFLTHCRTAEHIGYKYGVERKEIIRREK